MDKLFRNKLMSFPYISYESDEVSPLAEEGVFLTLEELKKVRTEAFHAGKIGYQWANREWVDYESVDEYLAQIEYIESKKVVKND